MTIFEAITLVAALCSSSNAQYFGRNKVQYATFDFGTFQTDHFNIYYYPEEREAALDAARMSERWYSRLSSFFNHSFTGRKPIIFYANHADFQQTNIIGGAISEGTGGVTEGLKDRVVIPLTGNYSDNNHVIGHELVHAFQYDIAQSGLRSQSMLNDIPLWFIEGMAEYLSLGRVDAQTSMWLRDAVLHEDIPTVDQLARDPRYFPYRFGDALWAFVGGTKGDTYIAKIYSSGITPAATAASPESTFTSRRDTLTPRDTLFTLRKDSLSNAWATALKKTYVPQLEGRFKPKDSGKRILAEDIDAGRLNLSPVISPDGKFVAFLSERDVFSIELFIADANTGKVIKSLTSSSTDSHFDALSFVNSAGTWSPDGKQFAFVVYADGKNEIEAVNVESGKTERRIRIDSIGAISTPSWSPDGRTIAFVGSVGGISDLYLYDLESGSVRQLTHDKFAEAAPTWSPDGGYIAFATDRDSGTDFSTLTFAPMRLAIMNVQTRAIELIAPFSGAKHINPQYSPDGKNIFFVSDRGGFNDIYRIDVISREVFQVTKLATGVSGLTPLSPAMSIARNSGRIFFTVFEHRDYNGYSLEPDRLVGEKVTEIVTHPIGAYLPPMDLAATNNSVVIRYLRDSLSGLPEKSAILDVGFRSAFQLDYVGGAAGAIVSDRFGSAIGGGITFYFSDVLSNHQVGVSLQSNGGIKDIGGEVLYLDLGHRWNWGVAASRIPYLAAQTLVGSTTVVVGGQSVPAQVVQQNRQRVFDNNFIGLSQYPLSTTRRLEFNAGIRVITYDLETERVIIYRGNVIDRQVNQQPSPSGVTLAQTSIAYVGDYSFFGFTSPASGGRYRLEADATFGTLNYFTALADYRRYILERPFTFAVRALHYGRYGRDAESNRLTPLFVGYSTFIRGYSESSFDVAECSGGSEINCPEFDRLIGSRIGVANMEIRLPVLGSDRYGLISFPYLPLELAGFLDVGAAWSSNDIISLKFDRQTTDRVPVFSSGVAARVNLFGYLVAEVFYVYPYQRPVKGWHWGFQIAPGW